MKKILFFLLLLFSQTSALYCSELKKTIETAIDPQSQENKELKAFLHSILITDVLNLVCDYCKNDYIPLKKLESQKAQEVYYSIEKLNFIQKIFASKYFFIRGKKLKFLAHDKLQLTLSAYGTPSDFRTLQNNQRSSIEWDIKTGKTEVINPKYAIDYLPCSKPAPALKSWLNENIETTSSDGLLHAKLLTVITEDKTKKVTKNPNPKDPPYYANADYYNEDEFRDFNEMVPLKPVFVHEVMLSIDQGVALRMILASATT